MENLKIIKTVQELRELENYIFDKDFIAYDVETDGVNKESHIIGVSVSADPELGFYVVLSYWDVEKQSLVDLETKDYIADFLALLSHKQLIMHNGIFDCWMTDNNFKVSLINSLHTDTMILGHILDENRSNGLKELGLSIFGEESIVEQKEMKESVQKNGGLLTKAQYELYKGDADLIGRYGAKDAILTIKLFYHLIPQLYAEKLDKFFYEEESMPLLKGPTYDLNTTGLKVDLKKLQELKNTLEVECAQAKEFIMREIATYVVNSPYEKKFNIGSSSQLAWLLFIKLENEFKSLTDGGRDLCVSLGLKPPYTYAEKKSFIYTLTNMKSNVYEEASINVKTKKLGRPKKVRDPWNYIACDKASLGKLSNKYKWVEKLLEYNKNLKLLNTYVEGIQERQQYSVIRPSFLQHGTTSGRYSSKNPNFQNLPRDDKRVKSCIVARPGNVLVGSDFSQLEPRVFASVSQDEKLMESFKSGNDFYSTIGMEVFDKYDCIPVKDGSPDAFGIKYKKLRDIAKVVALSSTYGTTAHKMAPTIGKTKDEAQDVIDSYFEKFPGVATMMLESHELAKTQGVVYNLYGRPRRMPKAKLIPELFGIIDHSELEYTWRNILNLAVNHRIQSTGASIMNRAAIRCYSLCRELESVDKAWANVKIVMQVHDEIILEGPEHLANDMVAVLQEAMENTTVLPGVALEAIPKSANNLADLK